MIALANGKIVTPETTVEGRVLLIEKDRIVGIADDAGSAEHVINAGGGYIVPGFIDVHSDKIEQVIQPRPTTQMDFELALKECERELLQVGITTMYHAIALYKDAFFGESPLRTRENMCKLANLISNIHTRAHLIHHRVHLRIEIDNMEAFDIAKAMIEEKLVHAISFTDHTPGQGQYRNLEIYAHTITKYRGKEVVSMGIDRILEYHQNKETLSFEQLKELADLAHAAGIAVSSHDDDTEEKLELNREIGVDISEFPITMDTAKAAGRMGFFTVAGAPNILLGGSHSGNMSAAEAIAEDCVDILCSDYYPPAMLHGAFMMHLKHGFPLHEMINKLTLNPARALKIAQEYGSVEAGKKADLLIVQVIDGYPGITHAFVDGAGTSVIQYRR